MSRVDIKTVIKLRVLHIGPMPPPIGGMSTVLLELSSALQDRCEIQVFSTSKTTAIDRTVFQAIAAQLRLLWQLSQLLRQWRPDIVHIHTCSNFTFWRNSLDVILARSFGCKTILHIHGARFHQFLGGLERVGAYFAYAVFNRADCVIVLGQIWRERLMYWCQPETIEVIANGVSVPEVAAGPCNDEVAHIVCIANYEPRKGLEDLISAAAKLPTTGRTWRITFLGAELDSAYKQSLQQLAINMNVEDRVNLPGPVNASQIADYLRSAYLFCLPSYDEGLPMSMLEAMAHALPVVVTQVGAIPEVVDEGVDAFIYQAGDCIALTIALQNLLENPDLARRMGDNARQRLIRDYSLATMSLRVFDVYQRLSKERVKGVTGHGSKGSDSIDYS